MRYYPDQHPYIPGSWAIRGEDGSWLEYQEEDGKRVPHRFDTAADARQFITSSGLEHAPMLMLSSLRNDEGRK
jgi:hypothetical protein